MLSGNFAEMTTSMPFRVLLHAANLRHGTDGFTSPPKEGVLRIFSPLGPFFWGPWGSFPYFPIPLLPLRFHIFFQRFALFSQFLLQGSLVHLHPGLVVILLTSNRVDQPLARRPYMARIIFHIKDAYATTSPYFQTPDDYSTS